MPVLIPNAKYSEADRLHNGSLLEELSLLAFCFRGVSSGWTSGYYSLLPGLDARKSFSSLLTSYPAAEKYARHAVRQASRSSGKGGQ